MSPKEEMSNKTRQYMLIARIRDIVKAAVGPPEHPQIIGSERRQSLAIQSLDQPHNPASPAVLCRLADSRYSGGNRRCTLSPTPSEHDLPHLCYRAILPLGNRLFLQSIGPESLDGHPIEFDYNKGALFLPQ